MIEVLRNAPHMFEDFYIFVWVIYLLSGFSAVVCSASALIFKKVALPCFALVAFFSFIAALMAASVEVTVLVSIWFVEVMLFTYLLLTRVVQSANKEESVR